MRNKVLKYCLLAVAVCLALPVQAKKKQVVAPSRAWTLSDPLGLQYSVPLDTAHENYHDNFIPSLRSKAWATTGNYGAAGQDQIFFNRPAATNFFLDDAMNTWLPSIDNQVFYNTRIPMTLLGYATGGDKHSNQDRTQALFSGNVDKRLAIGAKVDYIYSKGSYDYQAGKNFMAGGFASYKGDRYELHTFFNTWNATVKESGGITDDRYITDPAAVQGGETRVNPKDILTNLTGATTKLQGSEFYMNHRYKVGYYHYDRDSLTDTIVGKTYVPVTSFVWTLNYRTNQHRFKNTNAAQDTAFFDHTYLHLGGTDEHTRYRSLRNTVGVSLLEGFNKWAKFGFSLYAAHELWKCDQVTDTVTGAVTPEGLDSLPVRVSPKITKNYFYVGGQLTKQRGSLLTYRAQAEFCVAGDRVGDLEVKGDVATRFRLMSDTVTIRGYGYFKNMAAPALYETFVSNHFAWSNDFSHEVRFRTGGELDVPHLGSNVNVGYETLKNFLYLGYDATPRQCGSPIHVLSATGNQKLKVRALHFDNEITYQTTSNGKVLPLPKLSVYSNLYVQFTVARVLHCQLGIDGTYYTKYYAPAYNPALMAFHNQRDVKCGDFAFANLYGNFRLKQARFFLAYTHFNKGMFGGSNYFSAPHYPLNPTRFQFGVIVNFVN